MSKTMTVVATAAPATNTPWRCLSFIDARLASPFERVAESPALLGENDALEYFSDKQVGLDGRQLLGDNFAVDPKAEQGSRVAG